jgi:hypothetical protein
MKKQILLWAFALCACSAVHGQLTSSAFNNGTIQAAGPRTGANGKNFFNIEGASNGSFASYGVADFLFGSQNGGVVSVNSLSVSLTESDAAFTLPGTLDFYLSDNTSASIDPGTSTLTYQTSVTPPGIDSQLNNLHFLGTGAFTTTGNTNTGGVDIYSFTPTGATASYIQGVLNSGGVLRLVIDEDSSTPSIAATFAGFSNTSLAGPMMSISVTAVPEPTVLALGGIGGAVLAGGLRRRQKSK